MAEYETKGKEEKEEAKRRKKAEPIYDQLKPAAEPEDSRAGQAEAMLRLQQTHGNRYVQRVVKLGEEAAIGDSVVSAILSRVRSSQGQGHPLPEPLHQRAEHALGVDLGDVRVHADEEAGRMVAQAKALAFTVGQEIFVPRQAFPPRQSEEWQILAHEVVHTVQQQVGGGSEPEREAEQAGQKILQGEPVHLASAQTSVAALQRHPAPDGGTITIHEPTFTSYSVTGLTLAGVAPQLNPVEWGRCTWNFHYTYSSTNGVATRVNIILRLTIRLPQWTGAGWESASATAKAEWQRMLGCLRTHENGHVDIARSWAPTLQQRLFNQPEADLGSLWEAGLADHQTEQDAYDTRTQHGQTQGVTLDLSIQ
jgi:predicted secreted Zn-dependent protease